jgi:predicted nucleotidyltransferase
MEFELPDTFKELLESLNKNKVRYLLIGGYAVGMHGHPRATEDIDLFISGEKDNAEKIVAALTEFGLGTDNLKPEIFTQKNSLVIMGVAPLAVDILNYSKAIDFESAFERRNVVTCEGVEVNLISLDDLIKNKIAVGRRKDLDDVEYLNRVNSDR